jgi:acetyltransferase-like isoleucine patch superfamily enzyme
VTALKPDKLADIGFAAVGANVLISDRASIYGAERIRIGDNVRIDDFCILSAGEGGITIGSHVHIAAYSSIIGAGEVHIHDFANISSRVSIYSSSDDYSGASMTNPMVPDRFKNVDHRPVTIGRHVIVGCGSVVLPGVTLNEGAAVGALSLVTKDCDAFTIYAGSPLRRLGARQRDLLELENEFRSVEGR